MVPVLAAGCVLAALPWATGTGIYSLRITTLMLIQTTYTVAFNIVFGHTRQLFLCVGALAGSSAYLAVILTRDLKLAPTVAMGLGTLSAIALGACLSYVAARRGLGVIFVGIVTLVVSLIFQNLLLGLRRYTNGETGIVTQGLGIGLGGGAIATYYVFLALLLAALGLYQWLMAGRPGLAFGALSEDELTAELAGIDVTRYKVLAAAVGSGLIGLTGALYADFNGFISPSVFALAHVDIVVLIALLLGGMRTLLGPVVGGALFALVDELVRPFGQATVLAYGVLLVVLFLVFREGLVPLARRITRLQLP
ncbi:MAG: branched-chain amino acid ABC transporter permease [Armatimonadota bacterium]|nr:branched-chain amino acid ABC transporter permease [Armatimonadota bacterium]MDR7536206.1 branched-chain amino acid ABC transporter permease [Armatimonadota bacterium]